MLNKIIYLFISYPSGKKSKYNNEYILIYRKSAEKDSLILRVNNNISIQFIQNYIYKIKILIYIIWSQK